MGFYYRNPEEQLKPLEGYLRQTYSGSGGSDVDAYGESAVKIFKASETTAFKASAAAKGFYSRHKLDIGHNIRDKLTSCL